MAYTTRNSGEHGGRFQLLDDKALRSQYEHLRREMDKHKAAFGRSQAQAQEVNKEMKRRKLL